MKVSTLSIIVGTAACNAACPFCVSKMTAHAAGRLDVDWQRFDIACRLAQRSGANTVLLTGKGEPTLWPALIQGYVQRLAHYDMPIVELQTNGILLDQPHLQEWKKFGLSLVCLSITHYDPTASNRIMGIRGVYDYWEKVRLLHKLGLSVRLNCTMLRDGIWQWASIENLIAKCQRFGVEQLTLRDVTAPDTSINAEVAKYALTQRIPAAAYIRDHLEQRGATPLLHLPHGAVVYDYKGQNVCVNNCLTSSVDPENIRQLIFFPDGRIAYDWKYPGARLL